MYEGGPYAERLKSGGIPVHMVGRPFERLEKGWIHSLRSVANVSRSTWRLYRHLKRAPVDILHGFLFLAYVPGAFAARAAGIPVVVTSRRSLGTYKEGRVRYLALEHVANRLTDLIIPNSKAVLRDVVRQERVPPRLMRLVWNAVEVPAVERSRESIRFDANIPFSAPCGIVIANLLPYKGHRYLIEAGASLRQRFGDVHFLLVGDGPERQNLVALVKSLGLGHSFHFVGTRTDVGSFINAADFGVLPSLEEGFSNALLEMMAAGLPVVATAVGGNVDAVEHDRTGLVVPPRDSHALAEAIARLLSDKDSARELGKNAARNVLTRFGYERLVDEMSTIYLALAAERGLIPPASSR